MRRTAGGRSMDDDDDDVDDDDGRGVSSRKAGCTWQARGLNEKL